MIDATPAERRAALEAAVRHQALLLADARALNRLRPRLFGRTS
jgi:hypothetical protein